MSSTYITSDIYRHEDAIAVGLEMDMEVKSEVDSDDENINSTWSVTSSVEEVFTKSSPSQSDEDSEGIEDEPLVEIDSITVPQELVKDEQQPSLLLFVNRDSTKTNTVQNIQSSLVFTEKSINLTEKKSLSKKEEEEIASRKAITKALRNVKRKRRAPVKDTVPLQVESSNYDNCETNISENIYYNTNSMDVLISTNNSSYEMPSNEVSDPSITSLMKESNDATKTKLTPKKKTPIKVKKKMYTKDKNKVGRVKTKRKMVLTHSIIKKSPSVTKKSGNDMFYSEQEFAEKENTIRSGVSKVKNITNGQSIILDYKKLNKNKREGKNYVSKSGEVEIVKPDSFDCTICGKKFREKSHLATHSRAHIDIRNYKCNECGSLFKTRTNLFYHEKTHEEAPFDCEKCNKTFPERKMLMRHIRVVHSGEGQYNCDQCGRSFKSANNLELHYTLHTGNKPFSCNVCGKSFVYKSTYISHMKAHEADDMFSCELCPTNVADKGELRRRCNHHSEARPWLCTVCGKGYPLKSTLKNHMKTHEPEKPYKCNDCGKSFMKKQSYECHMKIHAGENPQYMCDQCSQSYFNVFALKRHYLKHTSERRFICDICNKAFWMKDALKVHKRSHDSVKMFHCTQCTKAFAHKHTLVAHLRTHTSELPYTCAVCPKTFVHKYNLDRHEQQHSMPPMPSQTSLPLPPSLIMMAPPKHIEMPTLHIL